MAEFWNGRPGGVWVTEAERFDAMLAPFGHRLLRAAALKPGDGVLDVGCGNGAVSCEADQLVRPGGGVTGLDLSAPMLAVARQRAEEQGMDVAFLQGDAQTAPFDEQFDVVVSRFGVMFFDDPVAAFANLAKGTRPGGRLCFVCWQEMLANEWIAVPAMAVVAHVGIPELPEPGVPGPFALADAARGPGASSSRPGGRTSPSTSTGTTCASAATRRTSWPSCSPTRWGAGWCREGTPKWCGPARRPPWRRFDRSPRRTASCWAAPTGS